MRERPILFNADMVRAILEDRKTQTRRVISPQPIPAIVTPKMFYISGRTSNKTTINNIVIPKGSACHKLMSFEDFSKQCPYGKVGEQLWVRETWGYFDPDSTGQDYESPACAKSSAYMLMKGNETLLEYWKRRIAYKASFKNPSFGNGPDAPKKWHPSIHMPRWASRIHLEITHIRVERLNDISEWDAIDEGTPYDHRARNTREAYKLQWEAIYGTCSWDANPWVWVIEFKLMERSN